MLVNQILNSMNVEYVTVNVLEDELIRQGMKEYSQWPTFPQVYIEGEFYGGCDIMIGESHAGLIIHGPSSRESLGSYEILFLTCYDHHVLWPLLERLLWCQAFKTGCTSVTFAHLLQ